MHFFNSWAASTNSFFLDEDVVRVAQRGAKEASTIAGVNRSTKRRCTNPIRGGGQSKATMEAANTSIEKEEGASREEEDCTPLHADGASSPLSLDGGPYGGHYEKSSAKDGREGRGFMTIKDEDPRFVCVLVEWRSKGGGR